MADDLQILVQAARQVDVIDIAGRIIAKPRRHAAAATAAEVLALACAVETFWAVCLEADLLARAVAIQPNGEPVHDGLRGIAIDQQATVVLRLLTDIRSPHTPNEKEET